MRDKTENSFIDQALAAKFLMVAKGPGYDKLSVLAQNSLDVASTVVEQRGDISPDTQKEIFGVTDPEHKKLLVTIK